MKSKKWMKRIVALAACTAIVGAGAQVFAATSDSYTGKTSGWYTADITCKINGFDNPFGNDSCEASTKADPEGIKVGVGVAIMDANEDVINESILSTAMSRKSVRIYSNDSKSAKSGLSMHTAEDDNYGNFTHFLGCTFN